MRLSHARAARCARACFACTGGARVYRLLARGACPGLNPCARAATSPGSGESGEAHLRRGRWKLYAVAAMRTRHERTSFLAAARRSACGKRAARRAGVITPPAQGQGPGRGPAAECEASGRRSATWCGCRAPRAAGTTQRRGAMPGTRAGGVSTGATSAGGGAGRQGERQRRRGPKSDVGKGGRTIPSNIGREGGQALVVSKGRGGPIPC